MTAAMLAATVSLLASARLAFGFVLGEAEVRSALSQPLRLRIPYQLTKDEAIDAACVRVLPAAWSDIPVIRNVRPTLQSQDGRNYIVLESPQVINDPAASLTVEVKCGTISSTRGFVLLFDPPEWFAASAAPGVNTVAEAGAQVAQPLSELPAANPPRVRAESGAKPRPLRIQPGDVAALPAAPQKPAVVRKPRRPAAQERPVLRIEPARDGGGPGGTGNPCCFRFSYELTDRNGPPLTEDERETLRQEMHERMSDEDPIVRLQAVRNELGMLNKQLTASLKELTDAQARNEQQARAVRNYVFYAVYFVVTIALALALWQWLRMKRRRDSQRGDLYRAGDAAPTEPISIPEPEFNLTAAKDAGPQAPALDLDLPKNAAAAAASTTLALRPAAEVESVDPAQRAAEYQKAYVLTRFPEVAAGNIVLRSPASVIEGARIFYQDDHDAAKAVELLRIVIAVHPEHVQVWLALFEIFSQERMALEFSELARRYRDARDTRTDKHWPMIAKLGRELEPETELFSAHGLPPVDGPHPNWLNLQLDMTGDVLALELHTQMLEQRDKTGPANTE